MRLKNNMKPNEYMKLSLEKRVARLEKLFKQQKENKSNHDLQIKVLRLDWLHHGWTGRPEELEDDREEWQQAQEMIDLIKSYEK